MLKYSCHLQPSNESNLLTSVQHGNQYIINKIKHDETKIKLSTQMPFCPGTPKWEFSKWESQNSQNWDSHNFGSP
jgi:hypothetical protein